MRVGILERLNVQAEKMKKQLTILYLAFRHKEVPWYKKAFLLVILIYAASPIDLIPDFIPILGYLDDLLIVPLGIFFAIRMIPRPLWKACEREAEKGVTIDKGYKIAGAILVGLIWLFILYRIFRLLVEA